MNIDFVLLNDFMNSFLGNLCEDGENFYPSYIENYFIIVDSKGNKCTDQHIYDELAPFLFTYGFYLSQNFEILLIES
jgi:hypothetical protein